MKTTTKAIVAISMTAGLALGSAAARADQVAMGVSEPVSVRVTVKAEALERQARGLFSQPGEYGKASKLLLQAAQERELGDPERIRDLHMASRLAFYKGDEGKALELMTRAAEESLSVGDVIAAAHHFADAAFLAKENNRVVEAAELVKKATLLAASPLIAKQDRAAILARVQA